MTLKNIDKNNALFVIRNNQTFEDRTELVEITTEGRFSLKNGTYFLVYREYTEVGENSVIIRASGNVASMRRKGVSNARMDYIPNTHREVLYRVPYGELVIDLYTETVENTLSEENGGMLKLKYKLDINDEHYCNDMELKVILNESLISDGKGDFE